MSRLTSLSVTSAPSAADHVVRRGDVSLLVLAPANGGDFSMFPGGTAPASGSYCAYGSDGTVWFYVGGWAAWKNTAAAGAAASSRTRYRYVSASATAVAGDFILDDTTSGAHTLTLPLPAGLTVGDVIVIEDAQSQWGTHDLTVAAGTGSVILGKYTSITCNQSYRLTLIWLGGTRGFSLYIDAPGANSTAPAGGVALSDLAPATMVDTAARSDIAILTEALAAKADLSAGAVLEGQLGYGAIRIKNGFLQLKNATTTKWHSVFVSGGEGEATLAVEKVGSLT